MAKSRGWGNSNQNSRWNRAAEELKHDVKKELNYAMNDIRQKVVEHGWFQKQVTPDHSTHGFYHTDDIEPNKSQSQSEELRPSKFDEVYGRDYEPVEQNRPEQDGMDI